MWYYQNGYVAVCHDKQGCVVRKLFDWESFERRARERLVVGRDRARMGHNGQTGAVGLSLTNPGGCPRVEEQQC